MDYRRTSNSPACRCAIEDMKMAGIDISYLYKEELVLIYAGVLRKPNFDWLKGQHQGFEFEKAYRNPLTNNTMDKKIQPSVIEIIHTKQSSRQGARVLPKDEVTLCYSQTSGYVLRFSTELTPELADIKTASIARNTITGEIYLLMLKTDEGDMEVKEEKVAGTSGKLYRIIRGKDFALKLADLLKLPASKPSYRVKISNNISNTTDFYTIKFNPTNE